MAPKENLNDEESSVFMTAAPKRSNAPQALPILPIDVASLRFLLILTLSWVLFYASMNAYPKWTVETYIPWSFWLLHYLLIFGIIGGGWPLVAPFGMEYTKHLWGRHGRIILGLAMTGLAIAAAAALSTFFVNVWWGYPLFPGGAWFGIGLFWVTLWWVLDIQISPDPLIPHHPLPVVNMMVSSIICILIAVALFQFVDYDFPFSDEESNPEGPASASWWFGCTVSIIVWVHNFAHNLTFQRWPFTLIPNPYLQHGTLTATTVILGWSIYEMVIAAGVDNSFFADAIGASQISLSLYHSVAFDFWPYHGMTQPTRGVYSFLWTQLVGPFIWIYFCRITLQPIYDLMVDANAVYGDIFSLYTMIPWFSLHVVAPLLIIHHAFFMRWPLPPGGPPIGPQEVGFVQPLGTTDRIEDPVEEEKEELISATRPAVSHMDDTHTVQERERVHNA